MINRVCLIVLDSVGIGALPDVAQYGDVGAHTLGNVAKHVGGIHMPNTYALGLGNIENSQLPSVKQPAAAYGRCAEQTQAKDTTCGHWEMMGIVMDPPFKTFHEFPETMLKEWLARAGMPLKWLANHPSSGTEIIDQLGEEHMKTGAPIVYTSADSVFQVAAHEDIIPLEKLYELCKIARELLVDDLFVGRVIARPFVGTPGAFKRTENRKDYAVPPVAPTLLDKLEEHGLSTLGIGKIEDIFCHQGVTHVNHTKNNHDSIEATIDALKNNTQDAFIFANYVDFDMLYGHRNNPDGYAQALKYFDTKLPEIMAALKPVTPEGGDLLILTADHGCDPTTPGTDHSREYIPLLVYGGKAVPLGTRKTFADIAATIYDILIGKTWPIGTSFKNQIL